MNQSRKMSLTESVTQVTVGYTAAFQFSAQNAEHRNKLAENQGPVPAVHSFVEQLEDTLALACVSLQGCLLVD